MVKFDQIQDAINDIKQGKAVIVVDNEDRENEGDLIFSAEKATTELMAFTIRYTSGFVCCSVDPDRLKQLELPLMVTKNTDPKKTQYTITVDSKDGISTGISAHDRARTVRLIADKNVTDPNSFTRPGHVVPLLPNSDGVLGRGGHTEAAVDLCKLAGLFPAGVLCELVNDDGSMKRRDDCQKFAQEHNLKFISIEDLKNYIINTKSD
ncbi:hypothetical protein BB559_001217 [Furculomyces boomerangus]|uniref:3,4-dihydroxy-2-butanone 4-phosphate synthase n=2 Tax=Harpellales TaxID=61421 RepID=A0A2T9Z2Q2_9FUNG|nr:hypothetical protein BB559_001217 [Furculomyces boomerangus]PVZ97970.1 hypothetical protein BB558_006038 [Smittium angustum]PVZ99890.1 hypothetical protein BB558_004075 [Smittium angustum]